MMFTRRKPTKSFASHCRCIAAVHSSTKSEGCCKRRHYCTGVNHKAKDSAGLVNMASAFPTASSNGCSLGSFFDRHSFATTTALNAAWMKLITRTAPPAHLAPDTHNFAPCVRAVGSPVGIDTTPYPTGIPKEMAAALDEVEALSVKYWEYGGAWWECTPLPTDFDAFLNYHSLEVTNACPLKTSSPSVCGSGDDDGQQHRLCLTPAERTLQEMFLNIRDIGNKPILPTQLIPTNLESLNVHTKRFLRSNATAGEKKHTSRKSFEACSREDFLTVFDSQILGSMHQAHRSSTHMNAAAFFEQTFDTCGQPLWYGYYAGGGTCVDFGVAFLWRCDSTMETTTAHHVDEEKKALPHCWWLIHCIGIMD